MYKKVCLWILVLGFLFLNISVHAQKMKDPTHPLDFYSYSKDELNLTMHGREFYSLGVEANPLMTQDIESLKSDSGCYTLNVIVDRLTGKPSMIEGGIPWIPGTGIRNTIQPSDIGVSVKEALDNKIPVEMADKIARDFLEKYPNIFNVDQNELVLSKESSGPVLDYLYNVNYQWYYKGVPVENAWLNFHLNSGNLVLFGSTYICDTIKKLNPNPTISLETAWEIVLNYIDHQIDMDDEILEPGMLIIQPILSDKALNGSYYEIGTGMEYRLVYVMIFRKNDVIGDWEARVDAHTGELLFLVIQQSMDIYKVEYTKQTKYQQIILPKQKFLHLFLMQTIQEQHLLQTKMEIFLGQRELARSQEGQGVLVMWEQ